MYQSQSELTVDALNKIFPNSENLRKYGGVQAIVKGLNSDIENGVSSEESKLYYRQKRFGNNRLKIIRRRTFLSFLYVACKDKALVILFISALLSITIGLIVENKKIGWIDGVSLLFAIMIVIFVNAGSDYFKSKQFNHLSKVKEEKKVVVVRSGQRKEIKPLDLLVGDIVELETGSIIPADGLFLRGANFRVDESALVGDSDIPERNENSPFLFQGSFVMGGFCRFVVIAVGKNTLLGKTCMVLDMNQPYEGSSLSQKVQDLSSNIGKFGVISAFVLLCALIILWGQSYYESKEEWRWVELKILLDFFITAITLIVVAVPEGLPLCVTVTLAIATSKMLKEKILVRHLYACETMGNVTNLCCDKTGTLTANFMNVEKSWLAGLYWNKVTDSNLSLENFSKSMENSKNTGTPFILMETRKKPMASEVIELLIESICMNTTAHLTESNGRTEVIGSKTEGALLKFLTEGEFVSVVNYKYEREKNQNRIKKIYPFYSSKKTMSTLLRLNNYSKNQYRLYTKGAPEVILPMCGEILNSDGSTENIDENKRKMLNKITRQFSNEGLRLLAISYCDFQLDENLNTFEDNNNKIIDWKISDIESRDLNTLIGIVGIKDSLREGVGKAISDFQKSGVMVRLVTGDSLDTAACIAREANILTEGGKSIDGPKFRELSPRQLDKVLPRLQVFARMTPSDKFLLVRKLKEDGEILAYSGDGINDCPSLKESSIGFCMRSGTDMAKESCDVLVLDNNFSSLIKSVVWGRNVYDSVRKFIQFQLTVNFVAVFLTFALSVSEKKSPFSPVQLLWVNLIMNNFASLALATEPITDNLLKRKPIKKDESIITRIMWRNIIGWSVFQIALCVVLYFFLHLIPFLGLPKNGEYTPTDQTIANTILFNTFVVSQIFNQINCRSLSNDFNVFKGLLSNYVFIVLAALTLVIQFLLIQFSGSFSNSYPLDWKQWIFCILFGSFTLVIGALLKVIVPIKDTQQTSTTKNAQADELSQILPKKEKKKKLNIVDTLRNPSRI